MLASLSFLSLNTNGLNDPGRRAKVFGHLADSLCPVALLQETHSTLATGRRWAAEWQARTAGSSYWHSGTGRSCGVAVLFLRSAEFQAADTARDVAGRLLVVRGLVQGRRVQLASLYAPDRPHRRSHFFRQVPALLAHGEVTVIGGDFNVVEDVALDRQGGVASASHTRGLPDLTRLTAAFGLQDLWRARHPHRADFTWRSPGGGIRSRLDRFYASSSLAPGFRGCHHYPTPWSDHDVLVMEVLLSGPGDGPRGEGFWQLNTSVLEDGEYRQAISDFLAAWGRRRHEFPSVLGWWDHAKVHVKWLTISHCSRRRRERAAQEAALYASLEAESARLAPDEAAMEDVYRRLRALREHAHRGAQVRSRARDVLNGEAPSRYFFAREASRHARSTVTHLDRADGSTTEDHQEVLAGLAAFYRDLYAAVPLDVAAQRELLAGVDARLSPEQRACLDAPLTAGDLKSSLDAMSPNKSPGVDGIPAEFYSAFWPELAPDFTALAAELLEGRVPLPYQHHLGVLTLTHKRGPKGDLANWRPIALLCVDYKLLAKAMATRLRAVLPTLVHPDQTCSVPGRTVFENLYLVRDVVDLANRASSPAAILALDQEKAFDKVDHGFLLSTLTTFGFGPRFVGFIGGISAGALARVVNNGFHTPDFPVERGIRQGCPLSLPLYTLVAEVIAARVRANPRIRGFSIPGMPVGLKQTLYADDNTSITVGAASLQALHQEFHLFHRATGCTLNLAKLRGLQVGPPVPVPEVSLPITWNPVEGVKILGVVFFNDLHHAQSANWTSAVDRLVTALHQQRHRSLSLTGKRQLLATSILSKVWHLAAVFPMPKWAQVRIDREIFGFLWDGRQPEMIKREVLRRPKGKGGVGVVDVWAQQLALRIKLLFPVATAAAPPPWLFLPRYWLASRLAKYNPEWGGLRANTYPKYNGTDPPLYYREFLNVLRDHKAALLRLPAVTAKGVYATLTAAPPAGVSTAGERYWDAQCARPLPWSRLWGLTYRSLDEDRQQDVVFKLLHNALPTGERVARGARRLRGAFDPNCPACGVLESALHLFAECPHALALWRVFQPVYAALQPAVPFSPRDATLLLNVAQGPPLGAAERLLLTVTTYIVREIWVSRNRRKFERVAPNVRRSAAAVNAQLSFLLTTWFARDKLQGSLGAFASRFAVAGAVCSVAAGELLLRLPPLPPL